MADGVQKRLTITSIDQYDSNKVYSAIAFNGGFAARDFWLGNGNVYRGNYAFYNVLSEYIKLLLKDSCKFTLLPSSTIISLNSEREEFVDELCKVIDTLLALPMDEEIFNKAYNNVRENYARAYKEADFRAQYRALEFVEYSKDFKVQELNRDVDTITFDTFVECAEKILVLDNMYVYVLGNTNGIELTKLEKCLPRTNTQCDLAAFERNLFAREDAHIREIGRKNLICVAVSIAFLNPNADARTRFFLCAFMKELLESDDVVSFFDIYDAGFTKKTNSFESMREKFKTFFDERKYYEARDNIRKGYTELLCGLPNEFCKEAASLGLYGIDIIDIVNTIAGCTYENFKKVYTEADILVNEGQVIMMRGEYVTQ